MKWNTFNHITDRTSMQVTGESTTTVLSYEEDIWNMHCHEFVYINFACLWFRISPLEFSDVIRYRKTFYFLCIIDLVMCRQGCVNFQDILMIFSMLYEGCKGRYRNEIRNYFVLRLEWGGSFSNMTLPVYLYQYQWWARSIKKRSPRATPTFGFHKKYRWSDFVASKQSK